MEQRADGEHAHLLGGRRINTSYSNSVHHHQHEQQQHSDTCIHPHHREEPVMHIHTSLPHLLDDDTGEDINLLTSPRHQWYSNATAAERPHAIPFETASPFKAADEAIVLEPLYTKDELASAGGFMFLSKLPGLLIALLLNLFLSISFGQAFFPTGV